MKEYLDVAEDSAATTSLFWAHGQYKDKILLEQQLYGVNKLEGVGVNVMDRLHYGIFRISTVPTNPN